MHPWLIEDMCVLVPVRARILCVHFAEGAAWGHAWPKGASGWGRRGVEWWLWKAGGWCWWEGSQKGLPLWITVGLLLGRASPHKHTRNTHAHTRDSIPTAFQLCLDQCRASCPKPYRPQLDVGSLGGTWCETGQHPAAEPSRPPPPPHRPFLFSLHTHPAHIPR